MKTTIVLHDVYCDVAYPEYLHVRNRYYKNPTSFMFVSTSTSTLVIRKESSDSSHECIILNVIHHVLIKNICTCAV